MDGSEMTHRTPCQEGNNSGRRVLNEAFGPKPELNDELQETSEVANITTMFNLKL
jgi:hypothetical protein